MSIPEINDNSTESWYPLSSCYTNHQKKIYSQQLSCICRICQKDFGTISDLNCHIRTHVTDEELLRCQSCNKTFFSVYTLVLHNVRAHSKEGPCKCNLCHKTFAYKFRGSSLLWFWSYLTDHTQMIILGGSRTHWVAVNFGAPRDQYLAHSFTCLIQSIFPLTL